MATWTSLHTIMEVPGQERWLWLQAYRKANFEGWKWNAGSHGGKTRTKAPLKRGLVDPAHHQASAAIAGHSGRTAPGFLGHVLRSGAAQPCKCSGGAVMLHSSLTKSHYRGAPEGLGCIAAAAWLVGPFRDQRQLSARGRCVLSSPYSHACARLASLAV